MIPKVIHYCWFGGNPIPKDVKQCIASWKKYCPDYKIVKWDESNFDVMSNAFIREAYRNKAWAFVSDYARLKIVYENGGIYLDTDVELIKGLDALLNLDLFLGRQQSGEINTGIGFGAAARNFAIEQMMAEYNDVVFDHEKALELSCPNMNTKAIDKLVLLGKLDEMQYCILPAKYMDPLASTKDAKNLLCSDTISIHHYSASWTSGGQRTKRRIARLIGQDKILLVKKILKR